MLPSNIDQTMPEPIRLDSIATDEPVTITELSYGSLTFGREPENSVVINSASVSRRHGIISEAGSQWVYRDFGTTNGSWVNGIPVREGQLRLLRDGDIVLISDFPVKITSLADRPENEYPSILVFSGEKFDFEFDFSQQQSFVFGGDGELSENGSSDSQVEIRYQEGRLELVTEKSVVPVVVNALSVASGGVSSLVDRDVVSLGYFRVVVNDPASAAESRDRETDSEAMSHPSDQLSALEEIHAPVQEGPSLSGWESEAAKRKAQSGHKFIFGSSMSEDDPSVDSTIAMPSHEFSERSGFEMNASQRIMAMSMKPEQPGSLLGEKIIFVLLALVLVFLLGFMVYLIYTFAS